MLFVNVGTAVSQPVGGMLTASLGMVPYAVIPARYLWVES
jgi:hypothetical protein